MDNTKIYWILTFHITFEDTSTHWCVRVNNSNTFNELKLYYGRDNPKPATKGYSLGKLASLKQLLFQNEILCQKKVQIFLVTDRSPF